MDRYGGDFGAYDDAEPFGFDQSLDYADEPAREAPPSPVGQDERRMQVRAYNHWAGLLENTQFPLIENLKPELLDDFGPYGVLLDFSGKRGIEDPAIRFLGTKLADECGGASYRKFSDVPSGSLLSRITDHYLQILANQAPIGFEAEFVNLVGATVLYRGILLPWSSDGVGIDFIFGVINWKELADAATADALLQAIDEALEEPIPAYEGKDMDRMLDLSGFASNGGSEDEEAPVALPHPAFGAAEERKPLDLGSFAAEFGADEDEEAEEETAIASEWGAGFSGFGDEETSYAVDYGDQGLEDGEEDEDYDGVVDPLADDDGASLGLVSLVARGGRNKASVDLSAPAGSYSVQSAPPAIPQAYEAPPTPSPEPAYATAETAHDGFDEEPFELGADFEVVAGAVEYPDVADAADDSEAADDFAVAEPSIAVHEDVASTVASGDADTALADEQIEGLYDTLAAARELAQTARSSEDRGRKALYQAVARAYDFSLEAWANPEDFAELLADNGLSMQDRAPMTPVVKLVFGADYDKTRLTEYATVLGFAHRTGVARGELDTVLARAEGGLKGIVQAERQARKEGEDAPARPERTLKPGLARKMRKLDALALDDLAEDGPEFALVMVRRLPSGELVVVGEVPENVALLEKAARALLA